MAPAKKLSANTQAKDWQTQRVDSIQGRSLLRVLCFGLLATLFVGLLIYILPYSPKRTPMFVVAEAGYSVPWPTNGWANEDVAHLRRLDGELIDVHRVESANGDPKSLLVELRKRLSEELQAIDSVGTVMVYINCVCAVNRDNEPCIILKGLEPTHPETWFPLKQLVGVFGDLSPGTQKVIFVDGVRYLQNWNLAEPLNPFVERVEELVSSTNIKNVSVITSSSPGQISPSKNAFAASLTKAIAGARPGMEQTTSGQVTFAALLDRMDHWVSNEAQRTAERQQNISVFSNTRNKRWTASVGLNATKWKDVEPSLERTVNSNLTAAELDSAWQRYSSLAKDSLLSFDPEQLCVVERKLARLEDLAKSGPSLKEEAIAELAILLEELDDLRTLDANVRRSFSGALGSNKEYFLSNFKPHSLSLATCFGLLDEADVKTFRGDAARFSFDAIPEHIELSNGKQIPRDNFEEIHLAQMLELENAETLWAGTEPIRSALDQINKTSQYSVPSSPRDELTPSLRSYSMLLPELDRMRESARQLVDQLLIGPLRASTKDDLMRLLRRQEEDYQERYQTLCEAWQTLDNANHLRWFYLKWLAHPSRELDATKCGFELQSARMLCQDLVEGSLRLNGLLELSEQEAPLPLTDIIESSVDLKRSLSALQSKLDSFATDLEGNPNVDGYILREVQAIQMLPQLKAPQRTALRAKEAELVAELSGREVQKTDDDLRKSPRERVLDLADRGLWGVQKARQILPLKRIGAVESESPLRMLSAFRDSLYKQQLEIAGDSRNISGTIQAITLPACWQQSHDLRRWGCLWHANLDHNPHQQLRLILVQNMLRSLAHKSLLDCYGGSQNTTIDRKPFYEVVAQDYNEASRILKIGGFSSPVEFSGILAQTREQRKYLEAGMGLVAVDKSLIPGISPLHIDAMLSPGRDGAMVASGEAAIFLADAKGEKHQLMTVVEPEKTAASSTIGLPLAATQNLQYELRSAGRLPSGQYEFLSLFRGNRLRTTLAVLGGTGYSYDWSMLQAADATVTVFGDNQAAPSVLFILDCSESMASPVRGESGNASTESKLDIAVGSLLRMLRELSESGRQTRVGVMLLGHRMGWSLDAPLQLLTQPKLADTTPETMTPSQDVELVLPLGRFDASSYSKLVDYMNSVEAWGQSPLFLAVQRALDEIESKTVPSAAAIVMITDGLNYQFTPANRAQSSVSPVGENQIINEIEESQIPIHILGFSIAESDLPSAEATYGKLSNASQGSFHQVDDEKKLVEIIRKQLGTTSFTVESGDPAKSLKVTNGTLNQPARVLLTSSVPESRIVRYEDASTDVVMEGGEALQMRYNPSLGRFEPVPFDVDFPVAAELTLPSNARISKLIARVHRPQLREQEAVFSISLQAMSTPFTPRPKECFIQIEPLSEDGQAVGTPLYYFDNNWVADRAVPMLRWKVGGWPEDAKKARFRLWCKFAKTPAPVALDIGDFYKPGDLQESREFADIPAARFSINVQEDVTQGQLCVAVTQIHVQASEQIQATKVSVAGELPAQKTSRYFDLENGVASHIFRFNLEDKAALLQGSKIELTPMSSLREDAYFTETSIETELVIGEELLPFDAGEGPFEDQLPITETTSELQPSGS